MVYAPPRPRPGQIPVYINLYSDTQTRPTQAMKEAMMRAEVGDEQSGLDPTINALCERSAALFGKQAAIFLPTGTMCNQIAVLTHCRAGEAILAHETAHLLTSEGGAAAALTGVQIMPLAGPRGQFTAETLAAALIRNPSRYDTPQTLVEVEQTANFGGGSVWKLAQLNAVADLAHEHGIATHMDGARVMNAVVASGVAASDMVAGYDSVWLDFTKGLGAPLGAVLCGSNEFIDRAWRWKQRLGGALRQGGLSAAGCLYSLDHHIDRLAEDHANAKVLARGLSQIEGFVVEEPETNLVFCDVTATRRSGEAIASDLREKGLLVSVMGHHLLRLCTHLDVSRRQIDEALSVIRAVAVHSEAVSIT